MAEDRVIATNRRARHEYEILETVEAGLVLRGTEVKSLRTGQVNFKDSYATVRNGEPWLRPDGLGAARRHESRQGNGQQDDGSPYAARRQHTNQPTRMHQPDASHHVKSQM